MSLACSATHKKPVCDKCTAGTKCTKCCLCQPRTLGRPRKTSVVIGSEPHRVNPVRSARIDTCSFADASLESVVETTPDLIEDDSDGIKYASQAHVLQVLELMGCTDGHEHSVRQLPHIDIRYQLHNANDIDADSMKRIENVFLKGIKAWISMLLPNLRLKCEADMKISFSIQSAMAAIEVPVIDKEAQNKASFVSIPVDILSTIPTTIRDVLKCERRYTSMDARKLLVPLADVPQAYVASLLKISNNYVLHLLFQAKQVDRLYLTCGVKLQEYCETHSRVPSDSVTFAVSFIYSDDSITRLAWEAKKQTPNRDPKWKELKNVYAMRSLVLKQDVATMYKGYAEKMSEMMPGKRHIGRTLFYCITKHITGGGKIQEARAGVDYIKPQEQEHDAQQFAEYEALERLISEPNAFDEPATQQEFVKQKSLPFFDRLRHVALVKLHEDPTRLEEIADVLLTVHQCERRTFSTAYMVFDFKQKFLAKGFREGGDSYYGKKGMLWWGAGVYVKPDTGQDDRSPESLEENHVEIDFTTEVLRLQQPLEMMNTGNVVLDDNGEEDSEYEKEDGVCESEDNGEECGEECMEGVGGVEEDDGMKDDDKEDSEKEGEDDGEEECAEGVGDVEEDDGMKDDDKEDSEKEGEDDGEEECAEGVGDVEEDDGMYKEDSEKEGEDDGEEECAEGVGDVEDDDGVHANQEAEEDYEEEVSLHYFDCIVQGEQKADGNIVLSCLEAALHALKKRFPHVSQSGKDICDTHFFHQQTQVDAYLVKGSGGRKVSTPKQLTVALIDSSVSNATILLLKPDFKAPYRSAAIPSIPSICYNCEKQQMVRFYNCLGQKVPSICIPIPSCPAKSLITPMGTQGINFMGVTVLLNSDSENTQMQARKDQNRYRRRTKGLNKREGQRLKKQCEDDEALKAIQEVYPQCADCLHHFKSQRVLGKHICSGRMESRDALTNAMQHADKLLVSMDFTVDGAIAQASHIFETRYTTFEPNFHAGWAHTRKSMHPDLTARVISIIHDCWKAGETKDLGKVKISADGVFSRLEELQLQHAIRLSELPLAGKIRAVYQSIGQKSQVQTSAGQKHGRHQEEGSSSASQKKPRIAYEEIDMEKELTQWKKYELEVYLSHHHLKKTGNKPELVSRVKEHMHADSN
eukprot:Em0374g7a